MSAGGGGGGGGGHGAEMDFELNLAPIIDCFTVLITFMLVSASFISVSIIEASSAPLTVEASSDPVEPLKGVSVRVLLKQDGALELKLMGEETREQLFQATSKGPDFASLGTELRGVLGKWPETRQVTLSGEGKVEYRAVVDALENIQKDVPSVMLGGF